MVVVRNIEFIGGEQSEMREWRSSWAENFQEKRHFVTIQASYGVVTKIQIGFVVLYFETSR